jgi:hypothetical protein
MDEAASTRVPASRAMATRIAMGVGHLTIGCISRSDKEYVGRHKSGCIVVLASSTHRNV